VRNNIAAAVICKLYCTTL